MLGRSRKAGAATTFLVGVTTLGWGAASGWLWLCLVGAAICAIGIVVLRVRRRELSPW